MREWVNHPCTEELLRILGWELDSLVYLLIFKSDDELSTYLKTKGKIDSVDRVIRMIKAFAELPEPEEEKAIDEGNTTV